MFTYKKGIWQSDIFDKSKISHGFSTRLGGKSTLSHTASMNTGYYRGDSDETVTENIMLLSKLAGAAENVVCTPQIHSDIVRIVDNTNIGEGISREVPFSSDGFVTDTPSVSLLVRIADCTPLLFAGEKPDGSAVISAVHAGWRGCVSDISVKAIEKMKELGAENIKCAIGPCIHSCCFEVGEDFIEEIKKLKGRDFAARHIVKRNNSHYADLVQMNYEIACSAGRTDIDVLDECTRCKPYLYHSHRATGGKRGTMGAIISIR